MSNYCRGRNNMKSKLGVKASKRMRELIYDGFQIEKIGTDINGNNFFKYYDENKQKQVKAYLANNPFIYNNVITVHNYLNGNDLKSEIQREINAINNYIETLKTKKCA